MQRTVLKTLTYGLMHLIVAVAVAYAVTQSWQAALAVGLLEPVIQTMAYNVHERFWAKAGERPDLAFAHPH